MEKLTTNELIEVKILIELRIEDLEKLLVKYAHNEELKSGYSSSLELLKSAHSKIKF
jgi:hypothetical protein